MCLHFFGGNCSHDIDVAIPLVQCMFCLFCPSKQCRTAPPGFSLGIALDPSGCSGTVSGQSCQLKCTTGYDLVGTWGDHGLPVMKLRRFIWQLDAIGSWLRFKRPGDGSLTCQAETGTFTSSSAVCVPRWEANMPRCQILDLERNVPHDLAKKTDHWTFCILWYNMVQYFLYRTGWLY